jgi:hypothetical protein
MYPLEICTSDTYAYWIRAYGIYACVMDAHEMLSAVVGTALNLFRSLPYILMYGKVSRPFFLFWIGHIVAAIRQFVEVQLHRGS